MCDNILRYIVHTILLKCKNMFAMLILHALILHSGDNIENIAQPYNSISFKNLQCNYYSSRLFFWWFCFEDQVT